MQQDITTSIYTEKNLCAPKAHRIKIWRNNSLFRQKIQ